MASSLPRIPQVVIPKVATLITEIGQVNWTPTLYPLLPLDLSSMLRAKGSPHTVHSQSELRGP